MSTCRPRLLRIGLSNGASVDVRVSLVQDGTDSILTDEGLLSAGVRVFFNDAPVPSDPAVDFSTANISPNIAVFDDLLLPPITDLDPGVCTGISETVDLFSPSNHRQKHFSWYVYIHRRNGCWRSDLLTGDG